MPRNCGTCTLTKVHYIPSNNTIGTSAVNPVRRGFTAARYTRPVARDRHSRSTPVKIQGFPSQPSCSNSPAEALSAGSIARHRRMNAHVALTSASDILSRTCKKFPNQLSSGPVPSGSGTRAGVPAVNMSFLSVGTFESSRQHDAPESSSKYNDRFSHLSRKEAGNVPRCSTMRPRWTSVSLSLGVRSTWNRDAPVRYSNTCRCASVTGPSTYHTRVSKR